MPSARVPGVSWSLQACSDEDDDDDEWLGLSNGQKKGDAAAETANGSGGAPGAPSGAAPTLPSSNPFRNAQRKPLLWNQQPGQTRYAGDCLRSSVACRDMTLKPFRGPRTVGTKTWRTEEFREHRSLCARTNCKAQQAIEGLPISPSLPVCCAAAAQTRHISHQRSKHPGDLTRHQHQHSRLVHHLGPPSSWRKHRVGPTSSLKHRVDPSRWLKCPCTGRTRPGPSRRHRELDHSRHSSLLHTSRQVHQDHTRGIPGSGIPGSSIPCRGVPCRGRTLQGHTRQGHTRQGRSQHPQRRSPWHRQGRSRWRAGSRAPAPRQRGRGSCGRPRRRQPAGPGSARAWPGNEEFLQPETGKRI